MTVRKRTIDNSVKNIPQSEQTQSLSTDSKPNTRNNVSNPKKAKRKIFHKTVKIC